MKSLNSALIVHNPTAGDGDVSKDDLLRTLDSYAGYISYISVKEKDWTEILREKDFDGIFLAGGDGTVHKIFNALIDLASLKPIVYLIPTGTANNIFKTLQATIGENTLLPSNASEFYAGFLEKNTRLCFESMGFGVFPKLLNLMEHKDYDNVKKQSKLKSVFQKFIDIVEGFNGVDVRIEANETVIEDTFLLVEFTNLAFIGPNLNIAPKASPYDNLFHLVMVPQKKKSTFLAYLKSGLNGDKRDRGSKLSDFATSIKAEKVKFTSKVPNYHIDDTLWEYSGTLTVKTKNTKVKLLPFPKLQNH